MTPASRAAEFVRTCAEALSHRETVIDRTRKEADTIVAEAQKRLSADVVAAKQKINVDSEALARAAAEKLLARTVS